MDIQRSVRSLVIGLAAAVGLAGLPPFTVIAAFGPTNLGVVDFGRILVDPVTSHIFVSSPGSGAIVVLDFSGNIVKTITGEAGADAMAIRGSTLYVTLTTAGSIDSIDTGTLSRTGVLVSGLLRPGDLFLAGNKLWSTTGNCANWTVELVSVDPSAATPTVTHYPGVFNTNNALSYCARFASNPTSNPNLLLAWDLGLGPAQITTFDVSTGSPVQKASAWEGPLGNLQDVAVNPDGTHFITASGAPYEFDEWNIGNLQQDGIVYPAIPYPIAVATSAAGGGRMGGGLNAPYDFDFYAYQIGQPAAPLAKVAFGGSTNTVPSRGVALSPDATRAFVISGSVVLNIVQLPVPGSPSAPTAVTATAGVVSATVSWTAPVNPGNSPITGYTVSANPGNVTASTNGTTTSTVVGPLTIGVSFTFTVTATNSQGTGPPSAPSNAVVPFSPYPGPPTGVTATAGNASATVSWTAPANQGGSALTSYTVSSIPGNVTATTNAATTSTVVSPLSVGISYTFTVTATNSQGTGPPSAPSNPVVPTGPLPGPPTNVSAIPGDTYAFVSWSEPVDTGGFAITAYQVTPFIGTAAQGSTSVTGSPPAKAAIITGLTNGTTYTFVVAATTVSGTGPPSSPSNAVTPLQGGNYHPLAPTRILDSRAASQVGPYSVPWGPGGMRDVTVAGVGGVPKTGVSSVVLNVTVTNTSGASYLTVYPSGRPLPLASNLNWVAGQTVPNLVEVALGRNGAVTVYNAGGQTDVLFDVAGWVGVASNSLTKDGLYNAIVPNRVLDTRDGTGAVPRAPVGAGQTINVQVAGISTIPVNGASAVVLNVTITNPTAPSYLTVFPTGTMAPLASNLNFVPGQTVPNRVMVKLGTNPATGTFGWVSFFNSAGTVDVIADVGGWFTDATSMVGGTRFTGVVPGRIFDSRDPRLGPLPGGQTGHLTLYDQNGAVVTGVSAIVINVTATNATAASYLTLWPEGTARPLASDLNFVAGQTVPNLVVVKLGGSTFDVFNAYGSTDVVIDLVGFYGTPQPAPNGPAAMVMRLSPQVGSAWNTLPN